MCGITGIIGRVDKGDLKTMTDTLEHRGPDGDGFWINDNSDVGFGHRRLSIIELSDKGSQPMQIDNNNYVITFNGEIYNYIELRKELESLGIVCTTGTDTEVLIKAYKLWGEDCLSKLDGMFAFAIWDEYKQEMFCARDRFGEKPFFFTRQNGALYFASEIKSFWSVGIQKNYNNQRIFHFLNSGSVNPYYLKGSTFFNEINELKPGHFLKVKLDLSSVEQEYWNVSSIKPSQDTFAQATEKQFHLLDQSVMRRLRSDVPVGSSLSGGLDSSILVSLLPNHSKDRQSTFSARFDGFKFDEGAYIDAVLEKKDIDAQRVSPTSENFLNSLENLLYHQDEPINSASVFLQYSVMELAKKHNVTVLLDGQGADEHLGGYYSFVRSYLRELKRNKNLKFKKVKREFESSLNQSFEFGFLEKKFTGIPKILKILEKARSNKLQNRGVSKEFYDQFKSDPNPKRDFSSFQDCRHSHINDGFLQELLRYADRNSMAHSREVRLPYLDHKLVEYNCSLPVEYFLKDGWTKHIQRKAFENIIPSQIAWRKEKVGYVAPQEEWLAQNLVKEEIERSYLNLQKEGFISDKKSTDKWRTLMISNFMGL
ncbi:MAG: asparagine synthase (glutamine-hydrolyzing) [Salibacteraceae bacterium]|nr:asparagine synthase (glutamine-hydrolyzing) [Salibacteraceae bacterium]